MNPDTIEIGRERFEQLCASHEKCQAAMRKLERVIERVRELVEKWLHLSELIPVAEKNQKTWFRIRTDVVYLNEARELAALLAEGKVGE